MNKKILGWDFKDTKSLIDFVKNNKNLNFLTIFKKWADENGRQVFSVRNYFYKVFKMLKKDKNLARRLDIDENDLKQIFAKRFDETEERKLLFQILPTKNQKSVRMACLRLAGNDTQKMVRFQNKFRQLVKNNKELVMSVLDELKSKGIEARNPYDNNKIVVMPFEQKISDSDIQSLLRGVVKLVQKNIREKFEEELKNEKQILNRKLQDSFVELRRKDLIVEELELKNKKLESDYLLIQENYEKSQAINLSCMLQVKSLVDSEKMKELKNFLNTLSLTKTNEQKI